MLVAVGYPSIATAQTTVEDCYRAESDRFVFHSDPWLNLHHFLFQWARNGAERRPGDRRRAVDVVEQAQLGDLDDADRQAWERASEYYREHMIARDLLFDRDLVALRNELAGAACSGAVPRLADDALQATLVEAMPVYRRHWLPGHDAANKAWIAERLEALKERESVFAVRLAEAYGGEWPAERIRVDIAAYTNWAGGYTTNQPDHVTISNSYQGLEGLEILFHEVSHASFFEQRILGQVAAAFRARQADAPNRLSHAIQFATPAEILRSLLGEQEGEDYRSIAERVHERGSFRDPYQAVLAHWRPFLDGEIERAEALDRIAQALGAE